MRLFEQDSPFSKVMTKLFDLIILNFLILGTIIMTLGIGFGAAMTAGIYAARKEQVVFSYKKGLKESYKQGTIVWVFSSMLTFISALILGNIQKFGMVSDSILVIQYALVFEIAICSMYAYALISKYQTTMKEVVLKSILLAHRHFLTTLTMLSILIILYLLIIYLNKMFVIFLFSGFCYSAEQLIVEKLIIGKYTKQPNA